MSSIDIDQVPTTASIDTTTTVVDTPTESTHTPTSTTYLQSTPSPTTDGGSTTPRHTASATQVSVKGNALRISYKVTKKKSLSDAYLLWLFFGVFGAHHFYLGRKFFGVIYMVSFGLFLFGWLTDLCRLPGLVKRINKDIKEGPQHPGIPKPIKKVTLGDAYVLWLFPFGILGLHHFYMERYIRGVIYMFTLGLMGFGWMSDLCFMYKHVAAANEEIEKKALFPRPKKHLSDVYVYALFPLTGILGIHHYLLDRPVNGIFYTLTFGGMFIGYLVDIFRMPTLVDRYNKEVTFGKTRKKHLDSAYVYLLPFGILGFHHYYLGNTIRGIIYNLTFAFFGVFWIVDIFRLPRLVREHNAIIDEGEKLITNLQMMHSTSVEEQSQHAHPITVTTTTAGGNDGSPSRTVLPPSTLMLDAGSMMDTESYRRQRSLSPPSGIMVAPQYPITPPPEYSARTLESPPTDNTSAAISHDAAALQILPSATSNQIHQHQQSEHHTATTSSRSPLPLHPLISNDNHEPPKGLTANKKGDVSHNDGEHPGAPTGLPLFNESSTDDTLMYDSCEPPAVGAELVEKTSDHSLQAQQSMAVKFGFDDQTISGDEVNDNSTNEVKQRYPEAEKHGVDEMATAGSESDAAASWRPAGGDDSTAQCGVFPDEDIGHSKQSQQDIAMKLGVTDENISIHF